MDYEGGGSDGALGGISLVLGSGDSDCVRGFWGCDGLCAT